MQTSHLRLPSFPVHSLTRYLAFGVLLALASVPLFASPPAFFRNELVTQLQLPVSLTFLPDGHMLVLEKGGAIYRLDPSQPQPHVTLYMQLSNLDNELERGLLDITLDPDFDSNGHFYLYYSAADPRRFRVSRFQHLGTIGDVGSEVVVWEDNEDWEACCHYGGGLDFGPDGMLYLTTGDEFDGFQAHDLKRSAGKVLRFGPDGSIPPDNPFLNDPDALPWIWARGLRNPYRARWDVPSGRYFIGNVGGNDQVIAFEEIELGFSGAHFGWPWCEGPAGHPSFPSCDPDDHTDPLFAYAHEGFGASVTAGFVYRPDPQSPRIPFPGEYDGVYFYADYTRQFIRYLTFDDSGLQVTGDHEFDPDAGRVIFLEQGPDQALYYSRVNGEIRRIVYEDQAPLVTCSTTPQAGPEPLQVNFNCLAQDDQPGMLSWEIDFGDGTSEIFEGAVGLPLEVTHTYGHPMLYTARVEATDSQGNGGHGGPLDIAVGTPPDVVITSPEDGQLFRARDVITLQAHALTGSCPEGTSEDLTARIQWTVLFVHNEHDHPAHSGVGPSLTFEIPHEAHDFRDHTGFSIEAKVTDDCGLTGQDVVFIWPDKVDLTWTTDPAGLQLNLDSLPYTAPQVFDTLIHFEHQAEAPDQCLGDRQMQFDHWSDGGVPNHTVIVPESDLTVTAHFVDAGECSTDPTPPTNQPPVAMDDLVAVPWGGSVSVDFLRNDVDEDGDGHLHVEDATVYSDGLQGDLTFDPQLDLWVYTHDGTSELDTFTYEVRDHDGAPSNRATVRLQPLDPNHPQLDGLVLHLDADYPASILTVSGDATGEVSSLWDLSPSATVLTASGNPARLADVTPTGRHAMRFDGGGDLLRAAEVSTLPAYNQDRTAFFVVDYRGRRFGGASWGQPGEPCPENGNGVFGLVVDGLGHLTVQGWCGGSDFPTQVEGSSAGWQIQSARLTDGLLEHWKDGLLIDSRSHAYNTAPLADLVLGAEIDLDPTVDLDVAAFWVFDRALSDAERLAMETYLRQRFLQDGEVCPAPVASDDSGTVLPGDTITIHLLANDYVPPCNPGPITILPTPDPGGFVGADLNLATGELTYTHPGDASGGISFAYTLEAGGLPSNAASVSVPVDRDFPPVPGLISLRLETFHGLTLGLDQRVVSWLDLSGNGNDPEAMGDPRRQAGGTPTGRDAVVMDGFDDALVSPRTAVGMPVGNEDRSVFMVVEYLGDGFGGFSWGSPGTCPEDGGGVFGLAVDGGGRLAVQGWCAGQDIVTDVPGEGAGWMVQSTVLQDGVLRQYADGQLIDQRHHVFDTAADGDLVLGAEIDGSPHVAMRVAAVLVYRRALDPTERFAVETYLQNTYLGSAPTQPSPPVTVDDGATVASGGCVTVQALANDTAEGILDPNTLQVIGAPTCGAATPSNGFITYCHDADAPGCTGGSGSGDSFVYTVDDHFGQTGPSATVQVAVDTLPPLAEHLALRLVPHVGLDLDGGTVVAWQSVAGQAIRLEARGTPGVLTAITPGGTDAVTLDGLDDFLEASLAATPLPHGAADRTVFLVARYHEAGFGGLTWGTPGGCGTQANRVFGPVVDHQGFLAIQGWCLGYDFSSSQTASDGAWRVQSVLTQDGMVWHYADGQRIDLRQHAFDTDGFGQLVLGAEIDGDPAVAMDVVAVLIYDVALSDAERRQVESFLQSRYLGIQPPQDPPTTLADVAVAGPADQLVLDVLGNDLGPALDSGTLTLTPPSVGNAWVENGRVIYQHDGNSTSGEVTWTYTVANTAGLVSAPTTVTVKVLPEVAGRVLHLEGHPDTLVFGDAGQVEAWLDLGPLGHVLLADGEPNWSADLGGMVQLDGQDDRLITFGDLDGAPLGDADRTFLALVAHHGPGFGGITYGLAVCDWAFGLVADHQNQWAVQTWCDDRLSGVSTEGPWAVHWAVVENGVLTHGVDHQVLSQAAHVLATFNGPLVIGSELDGTPFVTMDVAAVLLYDRALDTAQLQAVVDSLRSRLP